MVWAKSDKIFNAIRPPTSLWDNMVNRCSMGESANNTFTSISYSCGLFTSSVICPLNFSNLFSKRFFPAFFRAVANLFSFQISRCNLHGLTAIFAGHFSPVIHWVFSASEFFPKPITAINRAKNSLFNMRPSGKSSTAIFALMLSIFFSSSSSVMPRNKSFSFIGLSSTSAFTKSILHI